jgi:serpin B
LALYKVLAEKDKGKNLTISPYSVGTAMAMALTAARGDTEKEMSKVLRQALSRDDMNKACGAVVDQLNAMNNDKLSLSVANALCLAKFGSRVLPNYKKLLKRDYRAELFTAKDVVPINAWVAKRTNGKIKKILERLSPLSICVLLNAVYFKGEWSQVFKKSSTRPDIFRKTVKQKIKIPMMRQTGRFAIVKRDGFKALEMPYKGGAVSMLVLLPDDLDGLEALEKTLSIEELDAVLAALSAENAKQRVAVALPKTKIEYNADLIPPFESLGMKLPFDRRADFRGLTGDKTAYISQVKHKTYVAVDEKGTEAAAATAVEFALKCIPQSPRASFIANHPFIFLIIDRKTEATLFIGRVVDPSATNSK